MKSNYDILGNHIRLIDTRNRESITDRVLGINIDKFFMPSVANVIGTDLSKYKLITKGKFACNPMHVGRDERLPVALYDEEEPAIVSPAYFMFGDVWCYSRRSWVSRNRGNYQSSNLRYDMSLKSRSSILVLLAYSKSSCDKQTF